MEVTDYRDVAKGKGMRGGGLGSRPKKMYGERLRRDWGMGSSTI